MTAFSEFHEPMRVLLGDAAQHGVNAYSADQLTAGIRTLFRLGQGPDGYASSTGGISPDVPDGNAFAIICYKACLLLIGGEDGANSYRTRALSVTDGGDRKRDLLQIFGQMVYEIESGGGCVFETRQDLMAMLNQLGTRGGALQYMDGKVESLKLDVTI